MKRLVLPALLSLMATWAHGEVGRAVPDASDVETPENLRRELRRLQENETPRSGGDKITYRDTKNARLGVGTITPACTLDVSGNICGTSGTITTLGVTNLTATTVTASSASITQLNAPVMRYSRPPLVYISATTIDVASNTSTANQTCILFRDGDYRCPTEVTSSTSVYRRALITETANFTSGVENSGLRSGYVEQSSTTYTVWAVKSQINSANYVLVIDTITPIVSNISTLDSAFGTNSYVYLGAIRNGDNDTVPADILPFVQNKNLTMLTNTAAASGFNVGATKVGIKLATTAGATTLTYTYSSGTGSTNIPPQFTHLWYQVATAAVANVVLVKDSAAAHEYQRLAGDRANVLMMFLSASEGVQLSNGAGSSIAYDIVLNGWLDGALTDGTGLF